MSTLSITKAYTTGAALTEAHIDNFRNGLLTLFNTDKLTSANFEPSMSIPSAKFTGSELLTADNTYLEFGNDVDAWFGPDSSKRLIFDTAANTTEIKLMAGSTYYMEFYTDKVYVPTDIAIENGSHTVLEALSSYTKPVLEWASATSVSISGNMATSNETLIFFPTGAISIEETLSSNSKYREADITNTARGYQTSSSGTARGGRRDSLSLTTNTWYCVYAARVRSGSDYDASSPKYILVYDSTLPYYSNESTLDSRYGEGNWVYLGLVRYGFGGSGSSSSIPKFKYSNKGWCFFYEKSTGHGGIQLATSTTDADNISTALYILSAGTGNQEVPDICGKIQLNCVRDRVSDWYAKDSNLTIVWHGGWQTFDTNEPHGCLAEFGWTADFNLGFYQERKSSSAGVRRSVCLLGFCDTYRTPRRQGIGI